MTTARASSQGLQPATLVLLSLGAATMIAHAFTGAGFGFHGDELQFMDDARHLAWGYVAYPPMTSFFPGCRSICSGHRLRGSVSLLRLRRLRELS